MQLKVTTSYSDLNDLLKESFYTKHLFIYLD